MPMRNDEYISSSGSFLGHGPIGYYWYDAFCGMYWNHSEKQWQKARSKECRFHNKALAQEEKIYFFESDDIRLEFFSSLALAA